VNALLIPADTTVPIHTVEVDGLRDLQALVGGYIEAIPYPGRRDVLPYFNEDGKSLGLADNGRATELLIAPRVPGGVLFGGDHIVGDCVLTGTTPACELADLPADLAAILTACDYTSTVEEW